MISLLVACAYTLRSRWSTEAPAGRAVVFAPAVAEGLLGTNFIHAPLTASTLPPSRAACARPARESPSHHRRCTPGAAPPTAPDQPSRSSSRSGVWAQLYVRQCLTAALQEVALSHILGEGDRRLVRQRCLGVAPQATEQIGANRVEHVIATEVEAVDKGERRVRSLDLGDRDRAVERDDRARS